MQSADSSTNDLDSSQVTLILREAETQTSVKRLRQLLEEVTHRLGEAHQKNLELSETIVSSAQAIDELQQTKRQLAQAQIQAELAQRNAILLSETIFERTHDAMLVLQNDCTYATANKNALQLFQFDPSDLLSLNVLEYLEQRYHLNEESWVETILHELHGSGSTIHEFTRRNGEETQWVELSFSVFTIGQQNHFLVTGRDITARKQYEERNRLLASVFENAQEGVVILDLEGGICEANPVFRKFSGLDRDQLLGRNLAELVSWKHKRFQQVVDAAVAGKPYAGRVNLNPPDAVCPSDRKIIYWGSISSTFNDEQQPTNLIAMFSDITQIEETQRRLHRQALHDNLTNLPNRRFFRQHIQEVIESSKISRTRFGVCFLDLDDFKIVNDTLGHDAGDQLLIQVADRIKGCIYRDCFLARFGGDEFALLIPELGDPQRFTQIAEQVVSTLNEPFAVGESKVYIGVSIGMTIYPDDASAVDLLLRHADLAMYHAKDQGKNTVRGFTPTLAAKVAESQNMLNDLRNAISNNDVNVVYQPKMCLQTNQICGCEALVRWSKNGIAICPSEFIEVAEKSGLILPLGDQILEMVMRQSKTWRDEKLFDGPIAVNLSPRQLADPEFIPRFQELLDLTQTQGDWFELEITENAMVDNLDVTLKRMEQLNKLGVRIAIDDFGTGYSSLNYLRTFPVSTLKIDLTFVRDLPDDDRAVAVAKTVLSLGHGLGLKVVAEGVENTRQRDFLKDAGCDIIQGYLVDRPLLADEFADMIHEKS